MDIIIKKAAGAEYELWIEGAAQGPFDAQTVLALLGTGQAAPHTLCQRPGRAWEPLGNFMGEIAPSSVPAPAPATPTLQVTSGPQGFLIVKSKSRAIYIVLAILMGWCGVHNLYALRLRWFGAQLAILISMMLVGFAMLQAPPEETYTFHETAAEKAAVRSAQQQRAHAAEPLFGGWIFIWFWALIETGRVKKDGNGNPLT